MNGSSPFGLVDPATRQALARLHESRIRLADWAHDMAARRVEEQQGFHPKSTTLRTLMSIGQVPFAQLRLPWVRWAFSAFLMLRSMRRR
ncbi:MAG: hypothetical protein ABW278_09925 [Steroidobacteraceae bacterium]